MDNSKLPVLLVVEDDLENQKFLRIFLKKNFVIESCDNADDFYIILNNKKIDIILMDVSLRGSKNGFQLTSEVKQNPKFKHLPIIGLSAHAFKKDIDAAYISGIDVFLTKPVDAIFLRESLLKVLKK